MKLILLLVALLSTQKALCQLDSAEVENFVKITLPEENRFINFLEHHQIDSCLSKISTETILKFGTKELKLELDHLYTLFKKYGAPKSNHDFMNSVQRPYTLDRLSGFGHNIRGTIEEKCSYYFERHPGEIIYSFTLYYWNYQNFGIIKYFKVYDDKKHSGEFLIKEIQPKPPTKQD